LFDIEDKRKV